MDFVNHWSENCEIPKKYFIRWLGIHESKFYDWQTRYRKKKQHNGKIPRDWWLEKWEKVAIKDYLKKHPT